MRFDFEKNARDSAWAVWKQFLREDPELFPHVVATVADAEHLHLWRVGTLGRVARMTMRGKPGWPQPRALALCAVRRAVLKAPSGPCTAYVNTAQGELMRRGSRSNGTEHVPCPTTLVDAPMLLPVAASCNLDAEIFDAVRFAAVGREHGAEYRPRDHAANTKDAVHFFREDALVGGTDGCHAYVQALSAEAMEALDPLLATGALSGIPASLLPVFDHAGALEVRQGADNRPHVAVRVQDWQDRSISHWYVETAPAIAHSPPIPQALPSYGGLDTARMRWDPEYFAAHHRVRGDDEDLCVVQVLASDLWRAVEDADVVKVGESEAVLIGQCREVGFLVGGRRVPFVSGTHAWPTHRRVCVDPARLRMAVDALRDQHKSKPEDWPIRITHQGAYSPLVLETDPMHVRGLERGARRVAVMPLRAKP